MRPINIRTMQEAKSTAAVEKLAGKINPQTIITGIIIGTKVLLKSLISSCLIDKLWLHT